MLQYLLSATIVWAISLAMYELFLKQETFHSWNRAYLLLSLAMGFIIPKISLQEGGMPSSTYIRVPVERIHTIRERVTQVTTAASPKTAHSTNWLLIVYSVGLIIALGFLMVETYRLLRIASKSSSTKCPGFTLMETHRSTAPFSFFRWIFISEQAAYEPAELEFIIVHERRHIQLLHSADIVLLQLLRTLLWFHPLMWWYQKRLQMVHEYQADYRQRPQASSYGRFLIEQQLMQQIPAFTNAFFHSPIKNRIMMLTKNASSKSKLAKYLLVLPVSAVLMLACNQYNLKPSRKVVKGNKVTFRGNEFEMKSLPEQTIMMKDSTGIEVASSFETNPYPVKMNGEQIYDVEKANVAPVFNGPEGNLSGYLYARLKGEFNKLHDGAYNIVLDNLVIDKSGQLAFYDEAQLFPAVLLTNNNSKTNENGVIVAQVGSDDLVDSSAIKSIEKAAIRALDNGTFSYKPATLNGKPIITIGNDHSFDYRVVIKNHQSSFDAIPEKVGVKFTVPE